MSREGVGRNPRYSFSSFTPTPFRLLRVSIQDGARLIKMRALARQNTPALRLSFQQSCMGNGFLHNYRGSKRGTNSLFCNGLFKYTPGQLKKVRENRHPMPSAGKRAQVTTGFGFTHDSLGKMPARYDR